MTLRRTANAWRYSHPRTKGFAALLFYPSNAATASVAVPRQFSSLSLGQHRSQINARYSQVRWRDQRDKRVGERCASPRKPTAWRLNTTKVLLMALVREHLQRRCERIVVATIGRRWQIMRARLLRDFVERAWARLNIRGAADVPETN